MNVRILANKLVIIVLLTLTVNSVSGITYIPAVPDKNQMAATPVDLNV